MQTEEMQGEKAEEQIKSPDTAVRSLLACLTSSTAFPCSGGGATQMTASEISEIQHHPQQ